MECCPCCQAELESIRARLMAAEIYIKRVDEMIDTAWTPPWKRLWFWVNGWPLYRLADAPRRRPWHRWTGV